MRGLDGLRGVAILLVLVGHAGGNGSLVEQAGVAGVSLFFVLSGYLITSLLDRELSESGRVRFGRFYLRRAARLLPAVALMLVAFTVLAAVGMWPLGQYLVTAATGALYVSNIVAASGRDMAPLGHLWSLATEEQFYLVWPVVFVAARLWRAALILLLAVIAGWSALVRLDATASNLDAVGYYSPRANLTCLAAGCLLAIAGRSVKRRWVGVTALAGLCVVAVGTSALPGDANTHSAVTPTLIAPLAVLAVAAAATVRELHAEWLCRLGVISYGVYLWHWPLIAATEQAGLSNTLARVVAECVAVGVAAASWHWVERPIRRAVRSRTEELPTEVGFVPGAVVDGPVAAGRMVDVDLDVVPDRQLHGADAMCPCLPGCGIVPQDSAETGPVLEEAERPHGGRWGLPEQGSIEAVVPGEPGWDGNPARVRRRAVKAAWIGFLGAERD